MIEKDCNTCLFVWEPSKLYTAYLTEGDRADEWEAYAHKQKKLAERFRQALNCEKCGGSGVVGFVAAGIAEAVYPVAVGCDACAEIRKEANEWVR